MIHGLCKECDEQSLWTKLQEQPAAAAGHVVLWRNWIAQGSRQALGRASGGRAAPPMAPMVFSYVIAVLKRVLGAAAPGLGRV
jgi:hypothetical protein